MKKHENIQRLLNLNYLKYTNKTDSVGELDLPKINCNTTVYPDFLALYSETGLYKKTDKTAICFYQYDSVFDGHNGLFNALYFDLEDILKDFKKRFEGVKFFISPDYSEFGDIHIIENYYRLFKSRIVSLWFIFDLNAIVIPNITFPKEEYVDFDLDGLEDCSVVAMSTKGHIKEEIEYDRLKRKVKHTVDKLNNLKAIIVYDVCGDDKKTKEAFRYATDRGIEIIIPDNTLKERNKQRFNIKKIKGKFNIKTDFYSGYEGEREIILTMDKQDVPSLHIWDGFWWDVFDKCELPGYNWKGFTKDYQLDVRTWDWETFEKVKIENINEYIEDVKGYLNLKFDFPETSEAIHSLYDYLSYAKKHSYSVFVQVD